MKGKINMKLLIVAMLCLILMGYFAYQKISNEPNPKQPIKKSNKKS
jgi:hypothetical protein